jgi:hypothetical protein
MRDGTGPPPKLSSEREKPVTDPAVAKGFGGQGRRSAHHGSVSLAVSRFTFQPFTRFLKAGSKLLKRKQKNHRFHPAPGFMDSS